MYIERTTTVNTKLPSEMSIYNNFSLINITKNYCTHYFLIFLIGTSLSVKIQIHVANKFTLANGDYANCSKLPKNDICQMKYSGKCANAKINKQKMYSSLPSFTFTNNYISIQCKLHSFIKSHYQTDVWPLIKAQPCNIPSQTKGFDYTFKFVHVSQLVDLSRWMLKSHTIKSLHWVGKIQVIYI